MFRLNGSEHGVDPTGLTLALILNGCHAVQHVVGKGVLLLTATGRKQQQKG